MNLATSTWIAIAGAGAAWVAIVISLLSLRNSRKALDLSTKQDERRKPSLVPYLMDGYVRFGFAGNGRVYAFLLSVNNRADSDNSIADIELRVTYSTQTASELTVRVRSDQEAGKAFASESRTPLQNPAHIDAHRTIAGWCFFPIEETILEGARIDRYILAIIDSHQNEATIEPIIVREYGSETKETLG